MSAPLGNTPGRKLIKGKYRWIARDDARKQGYPVTSVVLPDDQSSHVATCQKLWAEMLIWLNDGKSARPLSFDGTIASVASIYQRSDASPFRSVEPKTQRDYAGTLKLVCAQVGARRIDHLTGDDFRRWHKNWSATGLRGAQEKCKLLRIIMNYGAEQRFHSCGTAADILSRITFPINKKRGKILERHHVEAIIEMCLVRGDYASRSIALCQAIQFETTLRQTDVIGVWRPRPRALEITGAMHVTGRHYWADGITFERIAEGHIVGESIKESEAYDYPLSLMPLTSRVLSLYSHAERKGALAAKAIGEPMSSDQYRKTWRRVANFAGVPKNIWNRDSRSGGITEATDSGVPLEDARHLAGHKQSSTTAGYSRNKAGKIAASMKIRLASVQGKNVIGKPIGKPSVNFKACG